MRTVYIDPITFECRTAQNAGNAYIPYETERFDGKCDTVIEGHRIVPAGYSWTRYDGVVFHGTMIALCKPCTELDNAQREYERQLLKDLQENSILVSDLEAAYQEGVNSAYD